MIQLQYSYWDKKSETYKDGLFDFDDTKYWVGENNFYNVVSDFLGDTIGRLNYDSLTVKKIDAGFRDRRSQA